MDDGEAGKMKKADGQKRAKELIHKAQTYGGLILHGQPSAAKILRNAFDGNCESIPKGASVERQAAAYEKVFDRMIAKKRQTHKVSK